MFQHIKDLVELDDSGPKAWKLLRDVIQPNTLPMVIVLEKELAALSMKPGDGVKPVLDKIKDIYARMAAAGSEVSQMQQCTKIISVLDNSWDNLIPTLNVQQDKWTPEWLRQQILQEDFRRRHTGGGAANKTAEGYGAAGGSRGRGGGRGRGRGRGFGRGRGRGDYNEGHVSSGGRGSTRMEGACWYCKKAGHPWFKCFSRHEGWAPPGMKPPSGERARGDAVQGSGAQGDGAQGKADPGMFLMVEDVQGSGGDVGSVGKVVMHPLTHWVIDSGCTSHMTPRADLLDEVKPPRKIKFVVAASGDLLPVIGVGNAKVMGANGELVGLGNVLLVEGLSANLLSVRRLQKSKAEVTFGPTSCRAKLGKLLLWNLEEKSSCIKDLWQLPIIPWKGKPPATAKAAAAAKATAGGEEIAPTAGALDAVKKVQQPQQPYGELLAGVDATGAWAKASSGNGEADWETWHERLCHVNIPMLQKLVKDGCLKGLEVKGGATEIGSCPTCLETKFTKFPFSSSTGPAKAPLALVHMDVVGPTRALSLSGSRYFLTIVDDHTRAVWVYPLKTKGEVAAAVLKEWMPRAQRESGHKVKVIRTDNGGEFIGADFEKVLKRKGIQHQLTVPYNPQQNGVAERFNRTLQEGARTLLGRAGLPDPFWVTALRQVVVVKNQVLATVGDKQWVPYTKWYGSAPAVNMLRTYGCMVVFHVPKEKRGKQEASGRWVSSGAARSQPYYIPLFQQVLGLPPSTGPTPPLLSPPPPESRPASPESRPASPGSHPESLVCTVCTGRRVLRQRPPPVPGTHSMTLRPSTALQRVPLPSPPASSLPNGLDPESDSLRAASPTVTCFLATAVTDPSFESSAASALVAELVDFAAACHLDYVASLVAESESASLCPHSVGGTYVDEVPPPGANIVSGMWICRLKRSPGSPPVFKARYVARGFSQQQGVDFFQTFSPTPKMTTLRVVLHDAALQDYELHSLDFSTAFLQGSLHEEIWLRRPPGFTGATLSALGFAPSTADSSLFLCTDTTLPPFYVLVYVDDLVFATADSEALAHVKWEVQKRHTCTDLGPSTLRLLVLLTTVHSSVFFHLRTSPTLGMGLVLGGRARVVFTGHVDASWVDDLATQRSSQGYTFSLGFGFVYLRPTRLSSVLSSSYEAEIYAGAMAAQELCWLTYLLTDLGEAPRSPPVRYVDNKAMLALCQVHRLEHRTKHIALRYFLARELQQRGQLRLAYVATRASTADIFTKALQPCDLQRFCTMLGLMPTWPHLLTS
ncbi:unnamed protein product [Closterium sp. NIES-53]